MKGKSFGVIILIIVTLLLGVGAIIIGDQLSRQDVNPDDTSAASPQVTNADRLKTQGERNAFNLMWQTFINDPKNGFDEYLEFALGDGARYECKTSIADKVGTETLYGCDLNVVFLIHDFPKYISTGAIGPRDSNLNAVMDELITQSGMLQIAGERGTITLDNTFFNNPDKDHQKRLGILNQIRPDLEDEFVKKIEFEMMIIYFHDQLPPPNLTIEQARAAAETKMKILYDKIIAGELTMKEAGKQIENNNIIGDTTGISMAELDPLYVSNAYTHIKGHYYEDPIFIDPVFEEEIRSLGEGQMSTIRVFRDFQFPNDDAVFYVDPDGNPLPMIESGFVVFRVIDIDFGYSQETDLNSYEDVNKIIKDEYKENANIQL